MHMTTNLFAWPGAISGKVETQTVAAKQQLTGHS